ncbi:hypothetical protein GB931_19785 [Modestobacter sp. I12A-02628]|uniref:Uncharacterized protein n=1 Tax=Goekera deserti TaxID=2497753 RepID=A0A7K3WFI7_9ACTN|nr:hypothetical protein [Goekera deserti]MPR00120.1 hypothetical protein [Goekera deserti]NDI49899.1 hypothetical protein [Goekera deserti]NEL55261.1 hypothetical protein [Goekera deserti]
MTADEAELLDAVLGHEFPGVLELREQARQVRVSPGCACGCGTLDLHVPDGMPRSSAANPVQVDMGVVDADGDLVATLLLFVHDGWLSSLEVAGWLEDPVALPRVEQLRWDLDLSLPGRPARRGAARPASDDEGAAPPSRPGWDSGGRD